MVNHGPFSPESIKGAWTLESTGGFPFAREPENREAGMRDAEFPDPGIAPYENIQKHLLPALTSALTTMVDTYGEAT
jgi:hypothetical protein